MPYAAFISYSHAADRPLTRALQLALHRFAKPWYRLRALRIFRDETSLAANPALWPAIEKALGESQYFLLCASRTAAASPWVRREAEWWLAHRSPDTLLIVLTDGELHWDEERRDFAWERTDALPDVLRGAFAGEPLYVDLRWARAEPDLSLRHSRFRAAVLALAAAIHGRPMDEMDGEDVRQHRRTRRVTAAAVTAIAALAIGASLAAIVAYRQWSVALSRQLATQALAMLDTEPDLARLLGAEAFRTADTIEARSTLLTVHLHSPQLHAFVHPERLVPSAVTIGSGGSTFAVAGCVRADPDGSCREGAIDIRDVSTTASVRLIPTGQENPPSSIALSPDGTRIAAAECVSEQPTPVCREGRIRFWDINTGAPTGSDIATHQRDIRDIAFDPTGTLLVSGGGDGSVLLWDVRTWEVRHVLSRGRGLPVFSVAVSPDGRSVAAGGADGTVGVWSADDGRPLSDPLDAAIEKVFAVAFSPDGTLLASAAIAGEIRLWDAATWSPVARRTGSREDLVHGLAFADARTLLASADRRVMVLAVPSLEPIRPPQAGHTDMIFSLAASGQRAVSRSRDGMIALWNTDDAASLFDLPAGTPARLTSVALNAEGTMVAVGGCASAAPGPCGAGQIRVWHLTERRWLGPPIAAHQDFVRSIAFGPGDDMLASAGCARSELGAGCVDAEIAFWDVRSGSRRAAPLRGQRGWITALQFDSNGRSVASYSEQDGVVTWDLDAGQRIEIRPITYIGYGVATLAQDLARVYVGSCRANPSRSCNDGEIRAISASGPERGVERSLPIAGLPQRLFDVAIAPEGDLLAWAACAQTDARGSCVKTAVRLWSLSAEQLVGPSLPVEAAMTRLAFSGDGRRLAALEDGAVRVWDVTPNAWLARACAQANRNLSRAEWQRFIGARLYRRTCGVRS